MAEQIQETRERTVPQSETTTTRRVVSEPEGATVVRTTGRSTAARVVWYVAGVLLTVLAFRFVLSLLGANRGNPFADLIYTLSYPFVVPFFGLFGYEVEYGVARFEIETLVAMAVYALVAYGIVQIIRIARREP
jgi:uncharacterized protein YggT (Ycf19 family)